ncbi:MAG: FUSC family membrane protein, partial [Flavisolibacter sp.]
ALITGGGAWYIFISLFFYKLQPYRVAQRSLGESIRELASYVLIKADFYDPSTNLEEDYKKLVAQQIIVNEKQDLVREVLFKTRQIVNESTPTGRKLVWTFVETVDLFENVTATYYDYASLRKRFAHTSVIMEISGFIKHIGYELDKTGIAIQNNVPEPTTIDFDSKLVHLKASIDEIADTGLESILVLKKIFVNLRKLVQGFYELKKYFESDEESRQKKNSIDHSHFVGHQPLNPGIIFNNLTFQSSVFKHALRVAIACLAGYLVTKTISYGDYSYWILMTIAFILKPAFSLTRQRNIERIIGTLAGGLIGIFILVFITQSNVQFALMVLFMLLTYSFMRINYLVMVIFVTPFVLILFNMLGVSFSEVATERILDTVIGCAIALSAGYFLFPTWESEQLQKHVNNMRKANADYLRKISEALRGMDVSLLDYKLVRKEVYVSSANLSAAFQRMLSEPKAKQTNSKLLHQYVVLNHLLFSNIATVATTVLSRTPKSYPGPLQHLVKKSLHQLEKEKRITITKKIQGEPESVLLNGEDLLLKDQLEFIYKLTTDIDKTEKSMKHP